MVPITGSCRIHRLTLRPAGFVASRLSPSHRYRCTRSSSRSSPRLAGRIVVSLCCLSIQSHIRCGFDCLLTAAGSVVVVSSRRAVPSCVSCLLDSRLALPSHLMRLISSAIISPVRLPVPRHGWRGVRRGASGVLCLLDFILRSVPISADVDSQFVPFPSSAVSSLGLLALSARLRGR